MMTNGRKILHATLPVEEKLKFLIYTVPFHRIFIIRKALYNNIEPPGSCLSLFHSFMRRNHPSQVNSPGNIQDHGCYILVSQLVQWSYLECTFFFDYPLGTHFTDPWRDERLSQPGAVDSAVRGRVAITKLQSCCTALKSNLFPALLYLETTPYPSPPSP